MGEWERQALEERDRLRAELAEAKLERDTVLTDRYDTIQDLRAELVAKDARIAELETTVDEIAALASNGAAQRDEAEVRAEKAEARVVELEALCKAQHGAVARAERAEAEALKAKAHIAALCDAIVYSDSYGVQGSDFQCCHACSAGGAPNVAFKHDEHCPVGKAEASATEWWDDHKAAEEDRERAEAERDELRAALEPILVYYCDYLDNDENGDPETNRHVARARAALAPSPTGKKHE